jgi:hypothetical protein
MFLTIEDYKAVVDDKTLNVINQSSAENLQRAEKYAIEEIKSYIRAAEAWKIGIRPYDADAAFEATGENRNSQLVMYTCDVALYHLIAWLPQKMGFEIRETRYKRAIEWLVSVQSGIILLNIPSINDDSNNDAINIRWGSQDKNNYEY